MRFSFKYLILSVCLALPIGAVDLSTDTVTDTDLETSTDTVILSTTPVVAISSASVPRAWRQVVNNAFKAPETLHFVVKWGVISAGKSSLRIDGVDVIDGRPAYHLVSEAKTTGIADTFARVDDRNDAWLDVESLTTVRYTKRLREGKYKLDEEADLDQVNGIWRRNSHRIDKNRKEEKQGPLPLYALDVFGSLFYARTLPLEVGKTFTMDVLSGEKIYPLLLKVKKRETVKVPAGKFECFLVEPVLRGPGLFIAKGKKLEVWMTADERKMPVRMRSEVFIGHVAAELVKVE